MSNLSLGYYMWTRALIVGNVAGFRAYEMEDDVTKDLAEFSLANAIFAALVEAHACEQSARYAIMLPLHWLPLH